MLTLFDDYNLTTRNTFAMDVNCRRFVEYTDPADLKEIFPSLIAGGKFIHIGAGSNMLFTGNYDGTVLHSAVWGISVIDRDADSVTVRVGAGETMDSFILWACESGLHGIENLSGIPGEAGASAVQNVGAYGVEAADVIVAVHAFDLSAGCFVTFTNADCRYGYRDSAFKHPGFKGRYIIHAVDYRLTSSAPAEISYPALRNHFEGRDAASITPLEIRRAVIAIRDSKLPDPARVPSAGSFFKNPVVTADLFQKVVAAAAPVEVPHYSVEGGYKIPAAWLIDQCGWKGRRLGNAAVWSLQPLVIVNPDRKASPDEIIRLENDIIRSVYERFGVRLSPEVEHI